MANVTVYLPDELAAEVRLAKINVSQVCQQALRAEVGRVSSQLDDLMGDLEPSLKANADRASIRRWLEAILDK